MGAYARYRIAGTAVCGCAMLALVTVAGAQVPEARAVHEVIVHVASPYLSPDGRYLVFSSRAWQVSNRAELESGRALELEYEDLVGTGVSLGLRYTVRAGERIIASGLTKAGEQDTVWLPAKIGWKVPIRIDLVAAEEGWTDVTAQINQLLRYEEGKGFGTATVQLVKRWRPLDWMYLDTLVEWFAASLSRGGLISWILLLLIFPYGLALAIYHLVRLYLSPFWSMNRIRSHPNVPFRAGHCAVDELVARMPAQFQALLDQEAPQQLPLTSMRAFWRIWNSRERDLWDRMRGVVPHSPRGRDSRIQAAFLSMDFIWGLGVLAPLFGLLGTVMGMSLAFGEANTGVVTLGSLTQVEGGGAASQSRMIEVIAKLGGGINEALYTTVDGLIVGISLMLLYYICERRVRHIGSELATVSNAIWNPVLRQVRVTQ
ncbi:MAG: MotA/TolQ/ExbB proton channel family protein [candidate division KSB1 bacterium]|nr:MotA/TolQ/ExbB proton channel family protein [candidate division KSB1 bacterium]